MKPKLIIHFPCRGRVWQLFSNATVTVDGEHFETLTKGGQLWTPKRDTFLAMVRMWSSDSMLPKGLKKDAVICGGIAREKMECQGY